MLAIVPAGYPGQELYHIILKDQKVHSSQIDQVMFLTREQIIQKLGIKPPKSHDEKR